MASIVEAAFDTKDEAKAFLESFIDKVKEPLENIHISTEHESKFVICAHHMKTVSHEFGASGPLYFDVETKEPIYFEFLAWERDLGSGEECMWRVNIEGKEIFSKVIPT